MHHPLHTIAEVEVVYDDMREDRQHLGRNGVWKRESMRGEQFSATRPDLGLCFDVWDQGRSAISFSNTLIA